MAGEQANKLKKTIALVGMMGSGKSAVGKALATKLGAPFIDSDHEIERAANMTIAEIFARDGEAFFRKREAEVISRLLRGTPCVLSTGGGAFMAEANRDAITQEGASVWLDADLELLWSRVKHKNTRPLLQTANPKATLKEIYDRRVPIYALADLTVPAETGLPINDMADRVIAHLAARGDILEER